MNIDLLMVVLYFVEYIKALTKKRMRPTISSAVENCVGPP